jgi:segregation and condensation protein B
LKASQIVEGVLFASDAPLKAEEIARADEALDEDRVEEAIQELRTLYDETERAFQVMELGEGYQILTRSEFAPYLERFDTVPRPSRLSGPALETLAIIAYRQPIGRIEMEYIRGVGSAGVIRTLLDRDLIDVVGRAEGLGRPLLYGTTQRFLEHFGFASLDQLPRPEELPVILRDRAPLEELLEREDEEEAGDLLDVEAAPGGDLPEGDQGVLGREGKEDDAGQEFEALEEGDPPREGSHD